MRKRAFIVGVYLLIALPALGLQASEAGVTQAGQISAATRANQETAQFLATLRAKYQLPAESDFVSERQSTVGKRSCRNFLQTLQHQEIIGAEASICFAPDGRKEGAGATVCDGACIQNAAVTSLDVMSARKNAITELQKVLEGAISTVTSIEAEPVWVETQGSKGLTGAFKVSLSTKNSKGQSPEGRYVAYVDGRSGKLITYEDKVLFDEAMGVAYPKDRVTTPNLAWVQLTGLNSVDRLESALFLIQNEDSPSATGTEGVFNFDPADTHFDEVQMYYGLELALGRLMSWGYVPFGQLPIVVHYGDNYANAFYNGEMIALGDGDGENLLDTARDNTVVTHEYGHAVIDHLAQIKTIPGFGDGGAIHEGHADYLACAVYGSPELGNGVMPDGQPLRRCDTNLTYADRKGEPHKAGQVWSGALWEARVLLGGDVMDLISVDALMRVRHGGWFGSTRMIDMYKAVLASDQALFGGAHDAYIREIFVRRGFDNVAPADEPDAPDEAYPAIAMKQ